MQMPNLMHSLILQEGVKFLQLLLKWMALGTFSALQDQAPIPKVQAVMRLFLMSIPTKSDDVQCRIGNTFACRVPVLDCTDPTQHHVRGVLWNAGQSWDSTFFSSSIYGRNNFSASAYIVSHLQNNLLQEMFLLN